MNFIKKMSLLLIFWAVFFSSQSFGQANWRQISNDLVKQYSFAWAKLRPEIAANIGFREFDSKAMLWTTDQIDRELQLLRTWIQTFDEASKSALDLRLKDDFEVMRHRLQIEIDQREIYRDLHVVDLFPNAEWIQSGLKTLLGRNPEEVRKRNALTRFKIYVHGQEAEGQNEKIPALLLAAKARIQRDIQNGQALFPYVEQVKKLIADTNSVIQDVRDVLVKSSVKGWEADFAHFETQATDFAKFLSEEILPRARQDFKLPRSLYELKLRQAGIEIKPEEMIEEGRREFDRTYSEFERVAKEVAHRRNWPYTTPVEVLRALKKSQMTTPEDVLTEYREAALIIQEIITRYNIVSVPEELPKIRVGSLAESAFFPAPGLDVPPLLDRGVEAPDFIVPRLASTNLPAEDYNFPAAAVALTIHEGRPGHDLQYRSTGMINATLAQGFYAGNSVNAEGWALYSEEIIRPYLATYAGSLRDTDKRKQKIFEAQLPSLRSRLLRIARYYFDPGLHLGIYRPEDVTELYLNKIGYGEAQTKQEIRRYTFWMPGQAPSYFYGFKIIAKLKERVQEIQREVGIPFIEKCFNDAILAQGILPLSMITRRLESLALARQSLCVSEL